MRLATLFFVAGASASTVTPVQKVLTLMNDMLAKGQTDKAEEAKIYKEYADWKHDQDRDTNLEINDLKSKIEKLEAIRDKAEAEKDALTTELASLDSELAGFQTELKGATANRAEEHDSFLKNQKDLSESVDALDRAIAVMKSRQYNVNQPGESFIQQLAIDVPKAAPELMAFLQETQPQGKVYAYEFQSGGIVDLLKKLKKKFAKELYDAETGEANSQHAFEMERLNLEDEIKNAQASIANRQERRAAAEATEGSAKGQLSDSNEDLASSEKYLADLRTTFTLKSSNYKKNQEVRTDELKALSTAIEIISGNSVSGSADTYLPALVQKKAVTSFLQIRQKTNTMSKAKADSILKEVSNMLRERDDDMAHKSQFLSLASFKIMSSMAEGSTAGTKGPFDKVVSMIEDLVAKLEEAAAAEAEHKAFCDKEMKDNKETRKRKTSEVDGLTAKSEELTATISQLGKEIADLKAAEAALQKAMGEATELRNKEKAKAKQTVADAKAAQEALTQALGVLREFYSKQSFLQTTQVPEMAPYKGQQASKKGVVGMLEVIQSDFARLEADTTATENQAQNEYDEFMTDAKADEKAKHKDAFDKSLQKDSDEHELHLTKKKLAATQKELDAALDYQTQLKAACVVQKVSYEERVKMREEEIASLRDALEILEQHGAAEE